jgi:hypothetical protein
VFGLLDAAIAAWRKEKPSQRALELDIARMREEWDDAVDSHDTLGTKAQQTKGG